MSELAHFDSLLQAKLEKRKSEQLYRSLIISKNEIDFCSNDYLGFAKNGLSKSANEFETGATGSRLISGNSIEAEEAEKKIAQFHSTEAALIFNCGYMANIGLFSTIAGKGDTFVIDANAHASIIDGIRLSNANKFRFRHNDLSDLEKKLRLAKGTKFVVVESIYSMDGDEAPLVKIVEICKKNKALLIVDEAHAIGVWGNNGAGLINKYKLQKDVFAGIFTFGKALGLHGAAIAGSNTLKNYLINFARPFIYTTALPPNSYVQIQKAYQLLPETERQPLFELIDYFRNSVRKMTSFMDSRSQIQGIIIGDNARAKALENHLFAKGIYAKAILSPTVAKGSERLRISLHSFNTKNQVDLLLSEIKTFLK